MNSKWIEWKTEADAPDYSRDVLYYSSFQKRFTVCHGSKVHGWPWSPTHYMYIDPPEDVIEE